MRALQRPDMVSILRGIAGVVGGVDRGVIGGVVNKNYLRLDIIKAVHIHVSYSFDFAYLLYSTTRLNALSSFLYAFVSCESKRRKLGVVRGQSHLFIF